MRSKPRLVLLATALGALAAFAALGACTETPDDLPECVGAGTYCPSDDAGADGGADSGVLDAGRGTGSDAAFDAGSSSDAGQDASPTDAASEDAGNG